MSFSVRLCRVVQSFAGQPVIEPDAFSDMVESQFGQALGARSLDGHRVALGLSSRGIPNYGKICRAVADSLRKRGAQLKALPAMGSHGGRKGPTLGDDQVLLLEERHGITPDTLGGVPIDGSMDVQSIGTTSIGIPVYLPKSVVQGGWLLVPVGRVLPHSHFEYSDLGGEPVPFGSGMRKMLPIGFGKEEGAARLHEATRKLWDPPEKKDTEVLGRAIDSAARLIIDNGHVLCGVGIVDNALGGTANVQVLNTAEHFAEEQPLLMEAAGYMPNIPLASLDALVLHEIGKDVSGTGAAPQVIRRWPDFRDVPDSIGVLAMLRLTEGTHGSAFGVGWADVITRKLLESIDREMTDTNTGAAGDPELGKVPERVADNDRALFEQVLQVAGSSMDSIRLVYARNSKHLGTLWCSPAIAEEFRAQPSVASVDSAITLEFDPSGNIPAEFWN